MAHCAMCASTCPTVRGCAWMRKRIRANDGRKWYAERVTFDNTDAATRRMHKITRVITIYKSCVRPPTSAPFSLILFSLLAWVQSCANYGSIKRCAWLWLYGFPRSCTIHSISHLTLCSNECRRIHIPIPIHKHTQPEQHTYKYFR